MSTAPPRGDPPAPAPRTDPADEPLRGTVVLPGSKSITNRALLAAALARGRSNIENALFCDDSIYLADALVRLGVLVARDEKRAHFRVEGAGGPFPVREAELYLGNAGTATRFLTAALCLSAGRYRVDGDERMQERPIGDLVKALQALGASIEAPSGCPPVFIGRGRAIPPPGPPSRREGRPRRPAPGRRSRREGAGRPGSEVAGGAGGGRPRAPRARSGARVKKDADVITLAGAPLRGVDEDCSDIPDVVPTLATVALFARGRTRLRNVAHLRHKESDRIASIAGELGKLGGKVKMLPDGLEVEGGRLKGAAIDPWGDHRIAMSAALAGLRVPGAVVRDPSVVSKSFPGFFAELERLGARVRPIEGAGAGQ